MYMNMTASAPAAGWLRSRCERVNSSVNSR